MASDISKLFHRENFRIDANSLGTIHCGSLTLGMLSEIQKELKADNIDGVAFTRKLLLKVGQRIREEEKHEDGNDKNEAENAPIVEEEVDRLSDEEIQDFAREFLVHNPWLLQSHKDSETSTTTNEQGQMIVSVQPTPIDLPREITEQDSDYLVRVLRRYVDGQTERINRALRPYSGTLFGSPFSNTTRDFFRRHVSLSDQLTRTLRSLGPGVTGRHVGKVVNKDSPEPMFPSPPEDPVHETNRRLGHVLDHAEEFRPIILDSAALFQSMSDTALEMHADFNRSARQSLRISLLVFCVAAASLAVTALYSWWSYEQASVQDAQYQRNLRQQQVEFQNLLEQQDDRYRQLVGNQNRQLQNLIKRHDAQVDRLIESVHAANAVATENDTKEVTEALLRALESVQQGHADAGQ